MSGVGTKGAAVYGRRPSGSAPNGFGPLLHGSGLNSAIAERDRMVRDGTLNIYALTGKMLPDQATSDISIWHAVAV